MKRHAEQFARLRHQGKVHAPCVNAEGNDALPEPSPGNRDAILDFSPQTQHVPAHRAIHMHGTIGKAVHFFHSHALAVPQPGDHPSTFGAQVDG
jgi:hypothetical protein